jgi:hypothetical protein
MSDRDVAIAALADLSAKDTAIVLSSALVRLVCLIVLGVGLVLFAIALFVRDRFARRLANKKGRGPQ